MWKKASPHGQSGEKPKNYYPAPKGNQLDFWLCLKGGWVTFTAAKEQTGWGKHGGQPLNYMPQACPLPDQELLSTSCRQGTGQVSLHLHSQLVGLSLHKNLPTETCYSEVILLPYLLISNIWSSYPVLLVQDFLAIPSVVLQNYQVNGLHLIFTQKNQLIPN